MSASSPTPDDKTDIARWLSEGDTARDAVASLAKRADRLRRLKLILPIGGGVILAVALLWPAVLPSLPTTAWKNGAELAMFDLTYHGTSDKGQPFTVTADKATRNVPLTVKSDAKTAPGTPPPTIDLTTPKAQLKNDDGSTVALQAQTGAYDENGQNLDLQGQVQVENSQGTQLDARQLSVDFKGNRAWTDQPVTASGDFGTVNGEGMRLEDGGKTIIFTGQTHATLNGQHEDKVETEKTETTEPVNAFPSPKSPVQP